MSRVYTQTFDEQSGNELPNDTKCPECDGRIRADGGERTCEDCGLVVEERRIDHGPEWRTFEDDTESKSRVGAPRTTTRHDRGLSTNIGYKHDAGGSQLSAAKRRRLHRQRREHSRAQFDSKQERNEVRSCEARC
ncbi:TFIIB-type zinc ribbon-containing protein [Halobacterium hubeiense]|uniref:TFIIB-type zinc ribbon-containing protein n=1 Tax=Halobacterium hubeiense TaxID=1407499 RepID=UPI000B7F21B2|nr:TFIIB-type zinc ribbon-containing protein [Halobacterium hubeiense]